MADIPHSGLKLKELLDCAGFESRAGFDFHGHHLAVQSDVVEFLAILLPSRHQSASRRHLPPVCEGGERSDVNFRLVRRFERHIRDPSPVRRQTHLILLEGAPKDDLRLSLARQRQNRNLVATLCVIHQDLSIAAPVVQEVCLAVSEDRGIPGADHNLADAGFLSVRELCK